MKLLAFLFIIFFTNSSFSQGRKNIFGDWAIQSIRPTPPQELAKKLTASYSTELEKTRAIFKWITENISYRSKVSPARRDAKMKQFRPDEIEDSGPLKPLSERVAENVLRERVAVCDGYARLFKTLCDFSGKQSEIITGYARTGFNRAVDRFRSNHTWNAVRIDSSWYLLDATWASGYFTYSSDEFVQHYNDYYFLTPPVNFIKDHFPEDIRWTLLTDPPTFKEFERAPFKTHAFVKSKILSYKPLKGLIEVTAGDSLLIEIETTNTDKYLVASPSVSFDSSGLLFDTTTTVITASSNKIVGNKISCIYPVPPGKLGWLHIILNDEVVLLYKLKNKKDQID